MPMSTIGDLRQHFLSTRNTTSMKTELNTLVQELTTGQKSDLTAHLGAGQTKVASLDRQLQMLARFADSNTQTSQFLSTMQSALGSIEQHRASVSTTLLMINEASTFTQISDAGYVAQAGFDATIQALNLRSGDRSVFGGNDLDSAPLASSTDMMGALKIELAGLTDAGDIKVAIDSWFLSAGGGFEVLGYQGDTQGMLERSIDANLNVEIPLRADDQTLRETLSAFALGALAADSNSSLTIQTRQALMKESAEALFSLAAPLASAQGRVGFAEAQVDEASTRNSAQQSSYSIARNGLVSADPFETATRLESVQLQLETHYTLTARLSRLSLTEYLR